ncbi:uncharacterized protein DPP9-AS1 [Sus scrofa]|uniref:uncharacterized protein DPP9-AS1 n=1 Tax=Sus scrofa TaxID=9823 RepID=UPI000A2B3C98|nr:uncharacterized protein DPP9-AS1 [Sus scrofa]
MCLPRGLRIVAGSWVSGTSVLRPGSAPPWAHCLPASSSSSPPRGALTVPPAWGPLPRRSSHHAPPLPIRGRGPGLSLPQRAAGGVLCSRMPSWGQQWRAMRRGARPRGAAAGRNSHVARPLPRCLPRGALSLSDQEPLSRSNLSLQAPLKPALWDGDQTGLAPALPCHLWADPEKVTSPLWVSVSSSPKCGY